LLSQEELRSYYDVDVKVGLDVEVEAELGVEVEAEVSILLAGRKLITENGYVPSNW
jgi:hypothetical protein